MKTTYEGKWVFDTQLLIYALDNKSPFYEATAALFHRIFSGEILVYVAQQNIIEAEKVFIRLYKKPPIAAIAAVKNLLYDYKIGIISPTPSTYVRYHSILSRKERPVDIFDYYLAATMLDNGYSRILTGNARDFAGIAGIKAVNPFT